MIQPVIMPVVLTPGRAGAVAGGQIAMRRGLTAPVVVAPVAVARGLPPVVRGRV